MLIIWYWIENVRRIPKLCDLINYPLPISRHEY